MAGYRESFGSNVDYAFAGGRRAGGMFDLTSRLDRMATSMSGYTRQIKQQSHAMRDLASKYRELDAQLSQPGQTAAKYQQLWEHQERIADSIARVRKEMKQVPFDMMYNGFDKIGKGILKLNFSMLTSVFDFLIDSIKRVYELQERWTRAIGGFNMKMGGLTAGLKGATRAATQWSSTIRGLTNGDIQEGIEMFGEFSMAIGRVIDKGDQFSRFGIQLARGFNLGGGGAGQLSKVFSNIGMSAGNAAQTMSELVDGANLAHVPVNMLAKDIEESSVYMARFGKEGSKAFVTAAAYARKFTISMKELQGATERFDMFEDAAKTMAKLNSAFGLMANSMDLMLADDPAQRMEMIRQQFLAQGLTYDKLSVKQRRYAAETLQVSEDQLASLLDIRNAGTSYAEFQAKQAAKQKSEIEAKRQMELSLRKTAQTMYAFGMAFDRVTLAIAKAIRPLLEVFGLAKSGGKDFKSFGQVMESITVTVEQFFESLARNEKWQSFMRELAHDVIRLGKALKDWVVSGGAAELVGDLAVGMKKFYMFVRDAGIAIAQVLKPMIPVFIKIAEHSKEIVMAWLALKGFRIAKGAFGAVSGMFSGMGVGAKTGRSLGGIAKAGGRMLGGMGTGALVGGVGEALGFGGSGAGGMLGGALGGLMGPIGGIVGSVVGAAAGHLFKRLFGGGGKSELDVARENLKKAMEAQAKAAKEQSDILEIMSMRQIREDSRRAKVTADINAIERSAVKTKGRVNFLTVEEARSIRERAADMARLGVSSGVAAEKIATTGIASDKELKRLQSANERYETKLAALREEISKHTTLQQVENQIELMKQKKGATELSIKEKERAIELEKKSMAKIASGETDLSFLTGPEGKEFDAWVKQLPGRMIKLQGGERESLEREFAIQKKKQKISDLERNVLELKEDAVNTEVDFARKEFVLKARSLLMQDKRFVEMMAQQAAMGKAGLNQEQAFKLFLSQNASEFHGLYGDYYRDLMNPVGMASGGIVRRPTYALIGEAGPEAVVPLRAMARGRMRQPMKFGGSAAQSLVQGGSQGGSSGDRVVIEVPVVIDGREVTRSIVGTILRSRS